MMKRLLILSALYFCTLAAAVSQPKTYTVSQSAVNYQIKNLGFNSTGTFGGLQANIRFDKSNPDSSRIEATIDVSTLDSGNGLRDKHLKSEDYFDAEKYPKIIMKSVAVKRRSGGKYEGVYDDYTGTFNITIKDKTKELAMPFTYTEAGNQATFSGAFTIKRSDFGIGGKSKMMADDVKVTVEVKTTF